MKYIRTKNKIYETDKDISCCGIEIYKVRNHDFSIFGNGLQKGDTIEELCDEFVVRDGCDKTCLEIDSNYESLKCNNWLNGGYIVYGCIWTDKGLIYVAKMNTDGVLILI